MIVQWNKEPYPGPARIFDANGQEIRDPVIYIDTETGEIRILSDTVDMEKGEIIRVTEFRPAPIVVKFGESCPDHLRLPPRELPEAINTTTNHNEEWVTKIPNGRKWTQ